MKNANQDATAFVGHELVKISDCPFGSLPLFLPSNVTYDAATNTVTKETNGSDGAAEEETPHLVKVPNAGWDMLNQLQDGKHKHKVHSLSVISCIGPYRTGKSLLTSRFLNTSKVFPVGPTLEGCTVGIWISTTALVDPHTKCFKLLLDVEGLGDPTSDDSSNARLALACLLLSSVFIFNNTSHPDRGSLQFLRCLSTIRQRIAQPNMPTKTSTSFVWVFRDFFLQLPVRKSTGKPYTLEEFVLERVLNNTTGAASGDDVEAEVVHSLLNDFASLKVLKVGHPRLMGQTPLSPEEMAHLDDLEWDSLDEGFRQDVQVVITSCLELAAPFQLGSDDDEKKSGWNLFSRDKSHVAKPKAYAKWCETVVEVVNSSGIIPNLPDLQNQLVFQMATEHLAECIAAFKRDLDSYWNTCPVYNGKGSPSDGLKPVAEEEELQRRAQECFIEQKKLLSDGNISSPSILADTLEELEARCVADRDSNGDDGTGTVAGLSILSKIRLENSERSRLACESLADTLYSPVQANIREDPTSMSLVEFQQVVAKLVKSYKLQARGPAKDSVMLTHLRQPCEADSLFITKVMEKNDALQATLKNLEEFKVQTQEKLDALEKSHKDALEVALAEQHKKEKAEKEALRVQMEEQLKQAQEKALKERQAKEAELLRIQQQADQRLQAEVKAREMRLEQEKQLFAEQMESLKESADAELKEKLALVESKSREEHERLEAELTHRLEESESRLQEEIRVKETELDETKKALEEKTAAEQELKERLERKICPCCVVM